MNIIYEVNLKVAQTIALEYLSWLHDHVREMLQLVGFLEGVIYEEVLDNQECRLVVHYKMASEEALQQYFEQDAPRMRQQALARFGDKVSISRRILRPL